MADDSDLDRPLVVNDVGVSKQSSDSFAITAALIAALGAFNFGITLAYTSPSLLPMEVSDKSGVFNSDMSAEESGGTVTISTENGALFSSILNIGAMLGSVLGGIINNKIGRKWTLLTVAVPFAASWFWMALSEDVLNITLGRFFTGVCSGTFTVTVPIYIAEISPVAIRGTLGALTQLMVTFGIFMTAVLGLVFETKQKTTLKCGGGEFSWDDEYDGDITSCQDIVSDWTCTVSEDGDSTTLGVCEGDMSSWRNLAYAGAVGCAALFILMLGMPESPAFLHANGHLDAARKALQRLRGAGADVEGELVALANAGAENEDVDEFNMSDKEAGEKKPLLTALWESRKAVMIGFTLMIGQQLAGINAVMFYCSSILSMAGMSNQNLGTVIVFAVQFVMTGVACMLMDRLGRKMLMIISTSGMTVFCLTLSFFFFNDKEPSALALISLIGYIAFFSLGFGPVPYLVMSELFPLEVRETGCSIAMLTNWMGAFMVTECFASLVLAISAQGAFLLFAVICALSLAFVVFIMPETKGKSLEQIQDELHGRTHVPLRTSMSA
mmetsp:Transcript_44262/g.120589  ORF Transcript_44262/g.120589 Transcript_44262/m.120589 type:complete len:555 (+) Transcript_44262:222-1886(+)